MVIMMHMIAKLPGPVHALGRVLEHSSTKTKKKKPVMPGFTVPARIPAVLGRACESAAKF